jgi:5'-3' exonuclease
LNERAYLIDGTAYVFRSFYALRPMEAPDGTPIHAVHGLGMTLQRLLHERRPERIACVFDAGPLTFRNDLYPPYKANRGEPPPDLVPQFSLCRELSQAMGLKTLAVDGFEADDVLATLSERLSAERLDVVLVSGDKDLAQLLGPRVRIYDLARRLDWGPEDVPGRLGVRAEQVPDLLGLMGDGVDNIPGVPGVGRVAATSLLKHFEDLEAIYAGLDAVEKLPLRGARSLRQKLQAGREAAWLSRELATLRRDVPLDLDPQTLRWEGAESEILEPFAETWGLGRLAQRIPRRPSS